MKRAKDLVIPFTWQDRKPYYTDRFWYVPWDIDLSKYTFQPLSELFGNSNPIVIEYCSGNGSWIIEQAKKNVHLNFLAVEKRFDRARKIWVKLHNSDLSNLIVVRSEGLIFTKFVLQTASISTVYINFPDPWPKRRHRTNRLIKLDFVDELSRIIKPKGQLHIVTDDEEYSKSIIATLEQIPSFSSLLPPPFFSLPPENWGTSYFHELFNNQQKAIRFHLYEKR